MIKRQLKTVARLISNEDGPTAVEYAVVLAVLVGTLFVAVTYFGKASKAVFEFVSNIFV